MKLDLEVSYLETKFMKFNKSSYNRKPQPSTKSVYNSELTTRYYLLEFQITEGRDQLNNIYIYYTI